MVNPWTGKEVNAIISEAPSKPDPQSFRVFMSDTLGSFAQKLGSIKPPSLLRPRLFRRAMRGLAAGLIFVYSIVFFFSVGSYFSVMFLATDLVLFYMLWLSRK